MGCLTVGATAFAVMLGLLALPLLVLVAGAGGGGDSGSGSSDPSGIPPRVLAAYQVTDGWCPGLRWQLLAGIGEVESGHGSHRGASADPVTGEVTPPILGIPLDGRPGVRALPIGRWLGWFGLTGPFQQAVGPMQFIPGTFTAWAVDADGDGVADPNDIDDAVASAANYLCGGRNGTMTDERAALRRYNNDESYIDRVLAIASAL